MEERCSISSLATPSVVAPPGKPKAGPSPEVTETSTSQTTQSGGSGSSNSGQGDSMNVDNSGSQPPPPGNNRNNRKQNRGGNNNNSNNHNSNNNSSNNNNSNNNNSNNNNSNNNNPNNNNNNSSQAPAIRSVPPYNLRLNLRMRHDGDWDGYKAEAVKGFTDLFGQIKAMDSTAILLPYKEEYYRAQAQPITTVQDAKQLVPFNREFYFCELKYPPRDRFRTVYCKVLLRLTKEPVEFLSNLEMILGPTKFSFQVPHLQSERVVEIGFFLRSHDDLDKEELEKAIFEQLQCKVEIRRKICDPKSNGARWTAEDRKITAMHVFIEGDASYIRARTALEEAYSNTATQWPLGIKMRFVAIERRSFLSSAERNHYARIRHKQGLFLTHIRRQELNFIHTSELNSPQDKWGGQSIRQILMEMTFVDADGTEKQLFHDVTRKWQFSDERQKSNPVLICYSPYHDNAVNDRMAKLIPRLKHDLVANYGEEALQPFQEVFTQEILQSHQNEVYNPLTNTVTNTREELWGAFAEADSWDIESDEEEETQPAVAVEGMSQVELSQLAAREVFGGDAQTLGSIRSGARNALQQSRVSFANVRALQGILRNGSEAQGPTAGAQ